MWSLTSLRTKRIRSFRNFACYPPKTFFDSIGQKQRTGTARGKSGVPARTDLRGLSSFFVLGPLGDIATHPRYRFTSSILFILDVESCISSLSYPMPHPPTGTVSFVFTDIEGSVTFGNGTPKR